MNDLLDKVALVTGGGQGIGQGIALALASKGASVSVVGRTGSKLEETVSLVERRGGRALAIVSDIKEPDAAERAVAETVATFGGLDVLVNNAQEFSFGTILDIPVQSVDDGWKSGPMATLSFMRAAHPYLRGGGVVVNVSSSATVDADIAGIGAYAATKAAIESLSRAAAVEWAGDGIRVNTIIPFARTPAVEASLEHYPGLEERLIDSVPLKRLGDPEVDIGPAVAYLAGPGAAFITGTTLSVDGGGVRLR